VRIHAWAIRTASGGLIYGTSWSIELVVENSMLLTILRYVQRSPSFIDRKWVNGDYVPPAK